jgi:hypothetical protein
MPKLGEVPGLLGARHNVVHVMIVGDFRVPADAPYTVRGRIAAREDMGLGTCDSPAPQTRTKTYFDAEATTIYTGCNRVRPTGGRDGPSLPRQRNDRWRRD